MNSEKKIERIIDLIRTDDSVEAPRDSITWAKNLYVSRRTKQSLVQRIAAVLQMDLAAGKSVMGERSGTPAQVHQMLFAAGDNAIDLRVTGSRKKVSVKGQILGPGFENAVVSFSGESGQFDTTTTASAAFELKDLPSGSYSLTALGKGVEITIERLEF